MTSFMSSAGISANAADESQLFDSITIGVEGSISRIAFAAFFWSPNQPMPPAGLYVC